MKIYIEGPDGSGKSTLANFIKEKFGFEVVHGSSETKNDFEYHAKLSDRESNLVLDRFNLGEIVYPAVYSRLSKMTFNEQMKLMRHIELRHSPYIIFYASNFEDLKKRLLPRGDTEQVLSNIEKINLCFKLLAEQLSNSFDNVYALDISKIEDQIKWFEDTLSDKVSSGKEGLYMDINADTYQTITITMPENDFDRELNKALLDGWELVTVNSFPVSKPDMIHSKINIMIVYTALLKRKYKEGM